MTTEVRQYEPSSDQGREIITAIEEVQFSQDTGLTWGNAIMQADSLLQETLEK